MDSAAPDQLQAIRGRIDRIDEEMHRLLIERSAVIDQLIRVKATAKPGAAFRPDREADMMRRLVVRHSGNLPLVTVEHIWREIITTFTAMQAPFGIAASPAADPLAMRDLVRFYFGFSVPVATCASAEEAVMRVAEAGNMLAVVCEASQGRWWAALCDPSGPKVFAKLPFIESPSRPAALPSYVVGPPLQSASMPDIQLVVGVISDDIGGPVLSLGGQVTGHDGNEFLIELPVAATLDDLAAACGSKLESTRCVGGFAQPIRVVPAHST